MIKNRPFFEMLIGLPGSGKSSYAQKWYSKDKEESIILSSDSIRKELYGDESIQGNPKEVFYLMQTRAIDALNKGYDVCYDATNLTRKDRFQIMSKIPKFCNTQATILWAPIEMCIENDKNRERTVGEEVIKRMVKKFEVPYYDEGFSSITKEDIFGKKNFEFREKILLSLKIPHDNPHHSLSILEHSREAYKYLLKIGYNNLAQVALFHDIGKPYTKEFLNAKGEPSEEAHYYFHQNVGAWLALGIIDLTIYDAWLINNHMEPFFNSKYYQKMPEYYKKDIELLHKADLAAH